MRNVQQIISRIIEEGGIMSPSKKRRKEKKGLNNYHDNKRIQRKIYDSAFRFSVLVCRMKFSTKEERMQHLEEDAHGSMYDTGSPQEGEDIRRLR
jgi:hypothetical protein